MVDRLAAVVFPLKRFSFVYYCTYIQGAKYRRDGSNLELLHYLTIPMLLGTPHGIESCNDYSIFNIGIMFRNSLTFRESWNPGPKVSRTRSETRP